MENAERAVFARTKLLNLRGDRLFAAAALSKNQHWTVRRRRLEDSAEHLLHQLAGTGQVRESDGRPGQGRTLIERTGYFRLYIVDIQRTNQHVTHPLVHQLDHLLN